MKNVTIKIIATLFASAILTSCNIDIFSRVSGNGNVVTIDRRISDDFSEIKVSRGINLFITQGQYNKITIEADENLHDIIITEVKNNTLKIYSKKNIWKAEAKKVYVTFKEVIGLKASSGSSIYGNETIETDDISIEASSGADIKINLESNNTEIESSSGASIKITGKSTSYDVSSSSGSDADVKKLEGKYVKAKASSGASIKVYASEEIEAKASSGGSIIFSGDPKSVNKKSSSGGSVSKSR